MIGIYTLAMVTLVPGTVLNLGAGYMYGVWGGYLVTLAGCMSGAAISFVLAKSGLRNWVRVLGGQWPTETANPPTTDNLSLLLLKQGAAD